MSLKQDLHLSEVFISLNKCACKAFSFISSRNVNQGYGLLKQKRAKMVAHCSQRGGAARRAWGQRQSSPLWESWVGRSPTVPQVVPDGLPGAWKGVDAADTGRTAQVTPRGVMLDSD